MNENESDQHGLADTETGNSSESDKLHRDNTLPSSQQAPPRSLGFPVVAIGASAGGLEACEAILDHLPSDVGLAIVFVQHLSPQHKSSLSQILARHTEMSVQEVSDDTPLQQNRVYVMPPDHDLAVENGLLHLVDRPHQSARHMPVDRLFCSLAEDQGNLAIGVVLSGTGCDGSLGLKAIKAEGGLALAQDTGSAAYAGMPDAAASTGQVDLVLPPIQIAEELIRIATHPRFRQALQRREEPPSLAATEAYQKVLTFVRQTTGVDFSEYKRSTVERRIVRRMVLRKADTPQDYLKYLEESPGEVHALFDDMLISVTNFFRDPEVFETLTEKIFPKLVEQKDTNTPVRIWVPACSSGEEVYSIAIAFLDFLSQRDLNIPIQIFGTDISRSLIEKARTGCYPKDIERDVSENRLRRYFVRSGSQYQISKTIRDFCVFAQQNVVKDPPISKIDFLSCRNFLIYLEPSLQNRAIPTFHYALKPGGFLLLGGSETIGGFANLFRLVDRKHKIYGKTQTAAHLPPGIGESQPSHFNMPEMANPGAPEKLNLNREADRVLLQSYAPPGVIVDQEMNILHFRGQTGRFLQPAPGAASFNLLHMARGGLAMDLRSLIREARVQHQTAQKRGIAFAGESDTVTVDVEVHPLGSTHSGGCHYLVVFKETEDTASQRPEDADASELAASPSNHQPETDLEKENQHLRQDLRQIKADMQSIIEEHESTNEELRAASEETQSANEELQSMNEELETAKEELQSTNEELSTVNAELESQNAEAGRAIDDLTNLHNAVDISVILLDKNLNIRSFTPPAKRQLGLRSSDEGRHIHELRLGLRTADLEKRIREVVDSLHAHKDELQSEDGRWYQLRIRPYRTSEDRIDGAILTFVDVTENRQSRQDMHNARVLAESIVATVRTPLIVVDGDLKVVTANPAFYKTFHVDEEETEGRLVYKLGDGQWNHPDLRQFLEEIIPENAEFEGFEITHDFPRIGRHRAVLDARRIEQQGDRPQLILLAINELEEV